MSLEARSHSGCTTKDFDNDVTCSETTQIWATESVAFWHLVCMGYAEGMGLETVSFEAYMTTSFA